MVYKDKNKQRETKRAYMKKYREKWENKEYRKKYNEKNKDKRKKYYEKNKDKINAKHKEYNEKNKDKLLKKRRLYKKKVLFLFGGRCNLCETTDYFSLCLDHINNDGNICRKNKVHCKGGDNLSRQILKRPELQKLFQLLCWNCNMLKENYPEEYERRFKEKNKQEGIYYEK